MVVSRAAAMAKVESATGFVILAELVECWPEQSTLDAEQLLAADYGPDQILVALGQFNVRFARLVVMSANRGGSLF
jgi:hypothetical protein